MSIIRQRYELQRELGTGASGSVWVARDTRLHRHVALKVLRAECEPSDWIDRFQLEAWTIAQLRSPHIVQVFDAGVDDERPYIVMELLEGESLEASLARRGALSLEYAASIVADITRGLTVTHLAGVVHRDLKPANVFLAREERGTRAKLLDFGIAESLVRRAGVAAPSSSTGGTPSYMSPEQFALLPSSAADDLWALSVMTYRMLTGHLPFAAESSWELCREVCASVFKPATALRNGLPASIDAFFARAFAREPEQRFASAHHFAAEFLRIANGDSRRTTRVLILDDEPDTELLMRGCFRREIAEERYELLFAPDGASGLVLLREHPELDVVLTDLNMPEMDGLTFLAHVPEVNPFVRVVVVTAYSDMNNIRAAMNRGAFDFLGKPFEFSDLKQTVSKSAAEARARRTAHGIARENTAMRLLVDAESTGDLVRSLEHAVPAMFEQHAGCIVRIEARGPSAELRDGALGDLLESLNAHYETVVQEVMAYGGRVIRLNEQGVFALFTAPDGVRRAADASLSIQCELGALPPATPGPCRVAIGIASGQVAFGAVGSHARGRLGQALLGSALHTAEALAKIGDDGAVMVASDVQNALGSDYACEPICLDNGLPGALRLRRRLSPLASPSSEPTRETLD
ncbi:MAG: hypothetical protein RL385_1023 [Pseudomonadota bacterium]